MVENPNRPSPEPSGLDTQPTWRLRSRTIDTADHTLIMGVLNVTPDSFSEGAPFVADGVLDHEAAIAHGMTLVSEGADVVDVGGESTRPGAGEMSVSEEMARVIPVVEGLAARGAVVSVDTRKPAVAAAALDVGAEIVNDITALTKDEMAAVCASSGCGVVLMHMQGTPATMQTDPRYDDVVADVVGALTRAAAAAESRGVDPAGICLDPGIGFGKTYDHNLELLRALGDLVATGYPVLVGASRKSFLGKVLAAAGHPAPATDRDAATHATVALAVAAGAAVVRVHDVAGALQTARIADAILRGRISFRK